MTAERQIGLDTMFERPQPGLLQASRLRLGELLIGEVGQGGSPPQRQRLTKRNGRPGPVGRTERLLAPGDLRFEAGHVKLPRVDLNPIAGRSGDDQRRVIDAARRQRPPQPGDVALKRGGGGHRRFPTPQLVGQSLGGDHLVGVEKQNGEQRPLLGSAHGHHGLAPHDLEVAEEPELDRRHPAGRRWLNRPTSTHGDCGPHDALMIHAGLPGF